MRAKIAAARLGFVIGRALGLVIVGLAVWVMAIGLGLITGWLVRAYQSVVFRLPLF